jgi:hypothetical protein
MEVQGHRIFFLAGKTGMEECRCTGKMLCASCYGAVKGEQSSPIALKMPMADFACEKC